MTSRRADSWALLIIALLLGWPATGYGQAPAAGHQPESVDGLDLAPWEEAIQAFEANFT